MAMNNRLLGLITLFLAAPALADQILANDIVDVGCFHPTDESCTGREGMNQGREGMDQGREGMN